MKRRIAILFHEQDKHRDLNRFAITFVAEHWRADGYDVCNVFGGEKFVPADLALLHVDLSVVPPEYLALARRYPIALNAAVKDIRKSVISRNLVAAGDSYNGPVIAKSNLNFAGLPERNTPRSSLAKLAMRARKLVARSATDEIQFRTPRDYQVYGHRDEVPRAFFNNEAVVIEKFLPELENGLYHVRNYLFLGDNATWTRLTATNPIVNDATMIRDEETEPQPEMIELRRSLRFDYGKFDYVVHEGKAILLDANKTMGASAIETSTLKAMRRHWADGIGTFFP